MGHPHGTRQAEDNRTVILKAAAREMLRYSKMIYTDLNQHREKKVRSNHFMTVSQALAVMNGQQPSDWLDYAEIVRDQISVIFEVD